MPSLAKLWRVHASSAALAAEQLETAPRWFPAGTPAAVGPPASIIPSPGSPGIAANTAATLTATLIEAGTIYFGDAILSASYSDGFRPGVGSVLVRSINQVVNHGTLWNRIDPATADFFAYNVALGAGAVVNDGLIVGEFATGPIFGAWSSYNAHNAASGRIYALTDTGVAVALDVGHHQLTHVTNDGLLAAQATGAGGRAIGLQTGGGTSIVNSASGSILAEGPDAIGIYYASGTTEAGATVPNIANAGLIRAQSLGDGFASVGVQLQHRQNEPMKLVNTGTIIADIAIYSESYLYSPPQKSAEEVVNEAGGKIQGAIYLDLGDDILVNKGTIVGVALLGGGADRFDNSLGLLDGYADLGLGNDLFLGSANTDAAIGGRDDDRLEGAGGEDLLIGGFGNDTLIGGAGNDGLFGEFGNDLIATAGSDFVWAGTGDDRIELGDYRFEAVDGGEGFDTLVLPVGARILDLGLVLASGALHSIEAIEMRGGQELVVRAADIPALAGSSLRVAGLATDRVDLIGGWTEGAQQSIGGVAYRSFTSGGSALLVAGGATVSIGAAPPAGATGLDPTAGALAPLPGEIDDVDLTSATTVFHGTYGYFLDFDSVTIGADETWTSENGQPVLAVGLSLSLDIVNLGVIRSATVTAQPIAVYDLGYLPGGPTGAAGLSIDNAHLIVNKGTISATTVGAGTAVAIFGIAHGNVRNEGLIEATAAAGHAIGVAVADGGDIAEPAVFNSGRIVAASAGTAIAIQVLNFSCVENHGRIEAIGGMRAVALGVSSPRLINYGEIIAEATEPGGTSYGLLVSAQDIGSIDNRGLIHADLAFSVRDRVNFLSLYFTNSGTIEGQMLLGIGWERIWNTGSISGPILFGGGNDLYDGRGGTQVGGVYGEAGDDTLIGGAGADVFIGGLDADSLEGGGGADRFVYLSAAESTSGAMDRIRAFQSGLDQIDLIALAPTSIVWTQQTDSADNSVYNLVTAASAGVTLVLRVDGALSLADFLTEPGHFYAGTAGDDDLVGAGGNDIFDGGAGADRMEGRRGSDTYYVDDAGDIVVELAGEGADRVVASIAYVLPVGAEVELLEPVTLGAANALDLTGNEFGNTIYGNNGVNFLRGEAGSDSLWGFGGDDYLIGGAGTDAMYGGLGNDTFYVDNEGDAVSEAGGEGNDRVAASVSYALAADAEVEQLEAVNSADTGALGLTGSNSANLVIGNAGVNFLFGQGGNDQLIGLAGSDFLIGGSGADLMYGGTGDDTFYVDNAGDRAYENAGEGTDRIATLISYTLEDTSEVELLEATNTTDTNAMDLTGSNSANLIIANAGLNLLRGNGGSDTLVALGGNDFLDGGTGADFMYGGTGDDTYYVDDVGDQANEVAGEGTDRIATSISYALLDSSEIELLESVNTTDTNAMDLTGSAFNNMLVGNAGANILNGGGGHDILYGLGGNDVFIGSASAGTMYGGLGNDTYYVMDGSDAVIEAAGQGADRIAAATSYTLLAGSEVETLEAVNSADTSAINLTGNAFANIIVGNNGANVIDGKGGHDTLIGYAGADTFAFTAALGTGNIDTITGFVSGSDKIALDDAMFTGLGTIPANAFVTGTQAQDADDRIIYNSATGALLFDADGNGAGAAVQFATLDGHPVLAASDFTVI